MDVLVTGGAGYIGSHTVIELLESGYQPIIVDNLSNSSRVAVERVEHITGATIPFYEADVRDAGALDRIFDSHDIQAVIHFAGLKAVGESVAQPLHYYSNNLDSTLTLLDRMDAHNVRGLVFSSSATVYGEKATPPFTEDLPLSATNPYGWTKVMIEQILKDVVATTAGWSITSLRYFNPVGAHKSGLIGEDPNGVPNNLMPFIAQVAVGRRDHVAVFGNDFDTPDGTGVRDYIHVTDLARAHVAALDHLHHADEYKVYNIGTGHGSSVLDVVKAFGEAAGKELPYTIEARRPGDIAASYASPDLALAELGWKAEMTIEDACADSWNWQSKNPEGYAK